MNASAEPVLKCAEKMTKSEPKKENKLPNIATMYHALNSFVFSQKGRVFHVRVCLW